MSLVKKSAAVIAVTMLVILSLPHHSFACACGCGVFEVGTNASYPSGAGGTVSFEYDFLNQNQTYHDSSRTSAVNDDDKRIRSDFYTAGVQYMFNRDWGVNVKVPYINRTLDSDVGGGDVEGFHDHSLGDVRVSGIYTGFSADMSTGVEFGLKLPTGSYTVDGFDRDTEPGTGSTDIMLGAYHRDRFGPHNPYNWFTHATVQVPVLTQAGYRPGNEFGVAVGVTHDRIPVVASVKVAPVLQVIGSYRNSDTGANADPSNTGYKRALISPGLEFSLGQTKLFTDISVPVYQHVTGDQLVAPVLYQAVVSYDF